MVYILNMDGKPLMPTKRCGRIRVLLKQKKAKVVTTRPFTVQLLYETNNITQSIELGIDSGYLNVGLSARTEKEELIRIEAELLQGQKERLKEKSMYRKLRRSRLRYRKPRFNNRKSTKKDGWLAPSIRNKLDSNVKLAEIVMNKVPVSRIKVEIGSFDIQKIKNPNIQGVEYQDGKQKDFWNTREYVLFRDNHKCQNPNCKNKHKNPILHVHHIVYQSLGGTDDSENLITLCDECNAPINHQKGHFLYDWMMQRKQVRSFREAAFMNIVRWRLVDELQKTGLPVSITYGSDTKSKRVALGLEKSHSNDAFCIADGTTQTRTECLHYIQTRRNNRCLEKFYDAKYVDSRTGKIVKGAELSSGRTSRNRNLNTDNLRIYRLKKVKKGYRTIRRQHYIYQPNDLVKYNNQIWVVKGCQNLGKYINLKGLSKPIKTTLVQIYQYSKGLCMAVI